MWRLGMVHILRFSPRGGKPIRELTTLLWAISWRMLGVTLLQNSSAVRIAVKLNSFWLWTFVATALCSQYTVQSWAKMNAWKREHMCSTEVWKGSKWGPLHSRGLCAPQNCSLHVCSLPGSAAQAHLIHGVQGWRSSLSYKAMICHLKTICFCSFSGSLLREQNVFSKRRYLKFAE